jgi:lysophospholipid acyltransferase (LPLAT)-like uncharacterized protein
MSDGDERDASVRGNGGDASRLEERARKRERRIGWIVRLGTPALRLLASSWRIREVNSAPYRRLSDGGKSAILALWHGELLALLWHFRRQRITVLISEHGDGEIVARVAHALGYETVRGSTSRGGGRALLQMTRAVQRGRVGAFTPDGPRGPARKFAPGALIVAQRSGAPVVALRVSPSRSWRLKSWDSFMIPKPFARVTISYGDPEYVNLPSPREAAEQSDRFEELMERTGAAARA